MLGNLRLGFAGYQYGISGLAGLEIGMNSNFEAPAIPTVQSVLASLLWLTAHPRRRACLNYQNVVLQQIRYLAESSDIEIEPMLRSVAEQLSDEIEDVLREQLAALRSHDIASASVAALAGLPRQFSSMAT